MSKQWHNTVLQNDIPQSSHHVCLINERAIAIFNIAGSYYAIEDNCPHQSLPISDGHIENLVIECPFHGAEFNIATGEVLSLPACTNLTVFEIRIQNGMLQVFL